MSEKNENKDTQQPEVWGVSIAKDELAALPAASYKGEVTVIDTPEKVAEAVAVLGKESVIGFDTETRPSFRKGQSYQVALLQLSTHERCFLIRLNKIGLPAPIKAILEDYNIKKIGVSIHDDFHNLNKVYNLEPQGFIDLQSYVKPFGITDNSLSRIYAILFEKRISKGQRLTNWEAPELTVHQQEYAALDALACISIYDYLNQEGFEAANSKYYRIVNNYSLNNPPHNG